MNPFQAAQGRAKPKEKAEAALGDRTPGKAQDPVFVVDQSSFRLGRAESLLADLTERDAESQLQWTR